MKPMIKLHRIGVDIVNAPEDARELWIDPFAIVSVVPNKHSGSVITLKQGNFFKVEENPNKVIALSVGARRIEEEGLGNLPD